MNKKRFDEIIENINKHNILQSCCGGMTSYDCMISELLEYTLDLQQENQQLKEELQQRDNTIIKIRNKLGRYADEVANNGTAYAICVDLLDILNKYKNKGGE